MQHAPGLSSRDANWLARTFARNSALFGGWSMEGPTDPPTDPPEGVSAEEWAALGDPGKAALNRERERATKAERELASARAKPAPPGPGNPPPAAPPKAPAVEPAGTDAPDIAAIVQQAVAAAIKPFQERDSQRAAEEAAGKIRQSVIDAARPLLHDASDAVAHIDLTTIVDETGATDPAKVTDALNKLVQDKPHLAKGPRFAPPGIGSGPGQSGGSTTEADRVKAVLADMQRATGVRQAAATN